MRAPGHLPRSLKKASGLAGLAALLWLVLGAPPCQAIAQPQAEFLSSPMRVAQGNHSVTPQPAASAPKTNGKRLTQPLWTELTPAQQQALAPLAAKWDTVSVAQKRKWIALSHNFPKLSAQEQATMHSRMSEWASLSPQQRIQARLNFGETQQLAPEDKKAKWEAYQALSAEEKRKLAAGADKPPAAAAAVKRAPPAKFAIVPRPQHKQDSKTPRIAAAPNQLDRHTLLPQRVPAPAPATTPAALPLPAPAALPPAAPAPIPPPVLVPEPALN